MKIFLYLTDDEIVLNARERQTPFSYQGRITKVQEEIENFLRTYPKAPLSLLIDVSSLDIREEKIPQLFPWDRIRFLVHKRAEYSAQGGYSGFQFLKEGKESYLRWVHVSENSSLFSWILWVNSQKNPLRGIFIVPLEGRGFLKSHLLTPYQMLIYASSAHTIRHVIFKGKRLLLNRSTQGEEGLKSSLHFLSRNNLDIHENISVLNLLEKDSSALLTYIASQKRPSFLLVPPSKTHRVRKGAALFLLSLLLLSGFKIYQGLELEHAALTLMPQIESLKLRLQNLKEDLENKDVEKLRAALTHYYSLKTHSENPLIHFEKLSFLIQKYQIRLEDMKWHYGPPTDLLLTFIMDEMAPKDLASTFSHLLQSCREAFPSAHLSILQAPFNSGLHETFKCPPELSHPLAQVRLIFP